ANVAAGGVLSDQFLGSLGAAYEPTPLTWSPDGSFIYTTRNDTLIEIPSYGGSPVQRPGVLSKATSFDFHRGDGRVVSEQPGLAQCLQCTPSPAQAFRRLALTDTTSSARDTIVRFYRRSGEFFHPRYSYDGIRIAYAVNQNPPTDRDVF